MKNILVVGGSKGIGAAIVEQLSSSHNIINISRTEPDYSGESYQLDVLEDDLPDLESLDGIIYCPGSITLKPIGSLKEENFRSDFEINVMGAVKVIKKYHRTLKKGNDPSIVLFSTVAVNQGMPFHASVAVAKAGVEALSKSLAAELAPNIRVNCVAPSITDTSLASGILRNEKSRENLSQKHPLKKILNASEVASMASFLISENASGITGQVIGVDAGLSTLKL